MKTRYFDHVATNPLLPAALDAMMPYLKEEFGNPLSVYDLGLRAKNAIEDARDTVASLINAKSAEIIFTASGAEANNMAIKGVATAKQGEGKHIIISKVEHHSVLNTARSLEKAGFAVTYLPVDKYGFFDLDALKKSISKETILISLIHASSEIGTIEPIKEAVAIAKERNITIHTDAVASTGNIPIDVKDLGVDMLSMSAHQFYGPKGAGALYLRQGQRLVPLIYGGIQENGRRAGTENVPAIVGMGKAAEVAKAELQQRNAHTGRLRDRIINALKDVEKVHLTGHPTQRLLHHASFVVEYIEGEGMLLMLQAKGIYAASGSACTSKALKASPTLTAINVSPTMAHGSIVFSLGIDNADEDIELLLEEFPQIIKRLRDISPFRKGWGEEEGGSKHV
ncbi:MAG: cysteine desulfurase [Candidatus Magnetoovum sp. WYHC-5]|nr:cysteine desulfurase [Candidatus Magnetoovum sp. WYHC-5]